MTSRITSRTKAIRRFTLAHLILVPLIISAQAHQNSDAEELRYVQIEAKDKFERSRIADLGVSIEAHRSDSVWGFATKKEIETLKNNGISVMGEFDHRIGREGHHTTDFPIADARFHNYQEITSALRMLAQSHVDIARVSSIGKSVEGREIWALHINTDSDDLINRASSKPGIIYMGNHHAREHLSVEIPFMFAEHLLKNRRDPQISKLLETRDIWIIPMVNPDGSEYDISSSRYRFWRKNRAKNSDGTYGVDLNRNYGYGWGTGGSSKDPSSEVYMGPSAFSEPETQAIRDFVNSQQNAKILLSFHTFSELILYPWGGTYDPISNASDRATFKKMAETMASWNRYTPQQSSELYIASGDTTDWAYAEHGIFAFTFELSPGQSAGVNGFYPGAGVIDKVFQDNLKPCLYLLDLADDPYRATRRTPYGFLKNYVEAETDTDWFSEKYPFLR